MREVYDEKDVLSTIARITLGRRRTEVEYRRPVSAFLASEEGEAEVQQGIQETYSLRERLVLDGGKGERVKYADDTKFHPGISN